MLPNILEKARRGAGVHLQSGIFAEFFCRWPILLGESQHENHCVVEIRFSSRLSPGAWWHAGLLSAIWGTIYLCHEDLDSHPPDDLSSATAHYLKG
jgi:hypothetical protein